MQSVAGLRRFLGPKAGQATVRPLLAFNLKACTLAVAENHAH